MLRAILSLLATFVLVFTPVQAQVTSQRLERAASEPNNWMTYSGGYNSQRYSGLSQIDRSNAKKLSQVWVVQIKCRALGNPIRWLLLTASCT